MPNPEHLAILREGTKRWNEWREENPGVRPDLVEADLARANLYGATFTEAGLDEANLTGAYLERANLERANLERANLYGAYLTGANLYGAILRGAILRGADLYGANLSEAEFFETVFADTDLTCAKGLETCRHEGPSTIDHRTLRNNPNLPERFLQGCGLSDLEIKFSKLYRNDLTDQQVTDIAYKIIELRSNPAIQFYSCFISYSSKDAPFAIRLHNDLQDSGVRCWFDKEDLKIGDKIRPVIHDAIRLQDKLLIILSEHSVLNPWVEDEVERALEKERRDKSTVLFPIRLDDSVMDIDQGWAVSIRNTRHIGDFRQWKEHDAYQVAFDRLLRDLRAS